MSEFQKDTNAAFSHRNTSSNDRISKNEVTGLRRFGRGSLSRNKSKLQDIIVDIQQSKTRRITTTQLFRNTDSTQSIHAGSIERSRMSKPGLSLLLFCGAASNAGAQVRLLQQREVVNYHIWDPSEIPPILDLWAQEYPGLISVTTAQEAYGLPTAGTRNDCPFDEGKGCLNYMFTIQDFVSHPPGSESSNNLPEVFWSGCVHGNERVGPTSVMEAANLLLESAHCEGLPKGAPSPEGLNEARNCRKALHNKGIDDVHRKWLARLVSTRRIVVVPTANGECIAKRKRCGRYWKRICFLRFVSFFISLGILPQQTRRKPH